MAPGTRRVIASAMIISLVALPGVLSAQEKRGADVIVTRRDGRLVAGELIAVRQDSLLLVNPVGKDESFAFADISSVKVPRKSHAGTGFLIGLLLGGIAGAALGHHSGQGDPWDEKMGTAGGIILIGGLGGLVGLGIGASMGSDETIEFGGLSEAEARKAQARLRGMARMRTAQ